MHFGLQPWYAHTFVKFNSSKDKIGSSKTILGIVSKFRVMLSQFKGPLSGLRQLLAIESALKMMGNAFYFMSKVLFVLEIFTFLYFLVIRKTA